MLESESYIWFYETRMFNYRVSSDDECVTNVKAFVIRKKYCNGIIRKAENGKEDREKNAI